MKSKIEDLKKRADQLRRNIDILEAANMEMDRMIASILEKQAERNRRLVTLKAAFEALENARNEFPPSTN